MLAIPALTLLWLPCSPAKGPALHLPEQLRRAFPQRAGYPHWQPTQPPQGLGRAQPQQQAPLGGDGLCSSFNPAQRSLRVSTTATTRPVTTMVRRNSGSGICRP